MHFTIFCKVTVPLQLGPPPPFRFMQATLRVSQPSSIIPSYQRFPRILPLKPKFLQLSQPEFLQPCLLNFPLLRQLVHNLDLRLLIPRRWVIILV
jgi:hypothetical protein